MNASHADKPGSDARPDRRLSDVFRELDGGEIIVKAVLPIDEFNDYFKTYLSENNSDTIGGLISQTLGHVPQRDESVQIDQIRFEIVHADSRRVHLIRVVRTTAVDTNK